MENVFVGRQAIYDTGMEVFAYELLFRTGSENAAGVTDGDQATSQVMVNAFMDIGLDALVGTRPAFINLTRNFLTGSIPLPFTPDQVVLEVLEDVEPEPEVIAAVRKLGERGFTIALDDFIYRPDLRPLVELADIIKIDLMALEPGTLAEQVKLLRRDNPRLLLLAEKIETAEELAECQALGFNYFQGYFFCKPHIVKGERLPSNRLVVLNLLAKLQDPDVEMEQLEELIIQDVSLAYRLIRYINSAAFGLRTQVDSVKRALGLLGIRTIKNWVSLILMSRIDDKPRELMVTALVRARMCELLAAERKFAGKEQFFTVGLFSLLDALMDRPLAELLEALPLSDEVKGAVLEHAGDGGELLSRVKAFEAAEWSRLEDGWLPPESYTEAYVAALEWARESSAAIEDESRAA